MYNYKNNEIAVVIEVTVEQLIIADNEQYHLCTTPLLSTNNVTDVNKFSNEFFFFLFCIP